MLKPDTKARLEQHIRIRVLTVAIWKKQVTQMEQHVEVHVRTAAIRMYSCCKRYAWCNYQRETL